MSGSVNWDFARKVAEKVSGTEPFSESYLQDSIHTDLLELTSKAERLVAKETGLLVSSAAKAKVIGHSEWVDANLSSFQRLTAPLLRRLQSEPREQVAFVDSAVGKRLGASVAPKIAPYVENAGEILRGVGSKVAGAELGALLGWMSGRVLGQYDLLIAEQESPEDQDWVYYVGPNILSLEKRYGFPPKEFRLWIAIHECTHRAQFMGVPWMRPYFLSLVNDLLDSTDLDSQQLTETLKGVLKNKRYGKKDSTAGGGLAVALANPRQRKVINRLSGLMSLLEGHGDIVMDRAGKDLIPSQPRFSRVMSQRRQEAKGLAKFVQRVTGMEAKLAQYEEGERFVKAVEEAGGRTLFDKVWSSPEALPTLDEIRSPQLWVDRVSA